MFFVKKTMLATVILTGMGMSMISASAFAGEIIDKTKGAEASLDLVFTSPSSLTNTLELAFPSSTAGNKGDNAPVAFGNVGGLKDGEQAVVSFTGPNATASADDVPRITLKGQADSSHELKLRITDGTSTPVTTDDGVLLNKNNVYLVVFDGYQPVEADTYTVSTVAYKYAS